MTTILCAECRAGDHAENELAVCLVSHPNPDHPNLRVRKWVCEDHRQMLVDDYGAELHTEQANVFKTKGA